MSPDGNEVAEEAGAISADDEGSVTVFGKLAGSVLSARASRTRFGNARGTNEDIKCCFHRAD